MITTDPDNVPGMLGTVAEEARRVLGIDVNPDRASRFQGPGWSYEGAIARACPEGHRQLHLFRRPYTTAAGKPATYTACVCSQCRTAFTMPDVGAKTYKALVEEEPKPRARRRRQETSIQPAAEIEPLIMEAQTELDHEDVMEMLAHVIAQVTDDRDRSILRARSGLAEVQTLQALGDHWHISRERVRQIQDRAARKISRGRKRNPLTAQWAGFVQVKEHHLHTAGHLFPHLADLPPATIKTASELWLQIGGVPKQDRQVVAQLLAEQARALEQPSGRPRSTDRASCRLDALLAAVEWPTDDITPTPLPNAPARHVGLSRIAGLVELPALGRAVEYESGLERRLLMLLDQAPQVETLLEQPCQIPYHDWDGTAHTYFPDTGFLLEDGRIVLVEVKPGVNLAEATNLHKFAAGRRYAHKHGWGWLIWNPSGASLAQLHAHNVPETTESPWVAAINAEGTLHLTRFKELCATTGASWTDVLAMILKHRWILRRSPLRLHKPCSGLISTVPN